MVSKDLQHVVPWSPRVPSYQAYVPVLPVSQYLWEQHEASDDQFHTAVCHPY